MKIARNGRQLMVWHGGLQQLTVFLHRKIGPKAFEPQTCSIYSTASPTLLIWTRSPVEDDVCATLSLVKVGEERIGEAEDFKGAA